MPPKKDYFIKEAALEKEKPHKDMHVPINEKLTAAEKKKRQQSKNDRIKKEAAFSNDLAKLHKNKK